MSTLFIVATPVGNLEDISLRAVSVLKLVDYIACEDTRTSRVLLNEYEIKASLFSFHQHNEHQKLDFLMDLLNSGKKVALISDAGMPGISDPGFLAVREAHKRGFRISVIPGPDAATTALVASGLPCDRYVFEGFVPRKKGRTTLIERLAHEERTVVLYESCHRIQKLLTQFTQFLNNERMIAVCRELTKTYEEIVRGPLGIVASDYLNRSEVKGEIVVIVAGKDYRE